MKAKWSRQDYYPIELSSQPFDLTQAKLKSIQSAPSINEYTVFSTTRTFGNSTIRPEKRIDNGIPYKTCIGGNQLHKLVHNNRFFLWQKAKDAFLDYTTTSSQIHWS